MAFEKDIPVKSGGVLHITDSSVVAGEWTRQGEAVLIWLHENNRHEDFGFCRYACEDIEDLDEEYLDKVYRRCKGLPWNILETGRCLIRETTVSDVDSFYEIYRDPSITKYMEALYEDPEEERAYAQDYIDKVYSFYDFGIWTVVEKKSGQVIGRAGICYREGYEDPEIGFMIGVPWQGQGYATEVCGAILEYVGEQFGFARILAFVQPDNQLSVRVCVKLGMRREEHVCLQGTEYDIFIWQRHKFD